ncbi:hypothetical protein D910_10442, partial [Dendroctonus ponderosae]
MPLRRGVPQGPVLGPLLFIVYINYFSEHIRPANCCLIADDTMVLSSGATLSVKMKNYPREECIDIIFTLGECHKNCLLASRVYAQKLPERNHPKPTVYKRLLHQIEESESVNYKKPITRKSVKMKKIFS